MRQSSGSRAKAADSRDLIADPNGQSQRTIHNVVVLVATKGEIIFAEVTDSITMDEAFGLLDSMADLAPETATQQGLIVIDEASALLDTLDRHKLGIHAARVLPRTMQPDVAAPGHLITPMFSNTARSRGLTVSAFDHPDDAEAWLASV